VNRTVLVVGGVIVTALLIFLALGLGKDPRRIESPLVGKEAPLFTLRDLDGNTYDLEQLRGKPVLINFWATWCQPCIYEHPILIEAAKRYEGRVHFLGVIYNDTPDLIRRFVAQRGAWGPTLIDPGTQVAIAYGVYGAPETFIIDPNGLIVEKVTSVVQWDSLTRRLDGML
jgi:cytochrome c biogenesis protein CcmG/thiol:disulfide interchange protein DsbE